MRADARRKVFPRFLELCVDKLSWCLSDEHNLGEGGGGGEYNQQRFIRGR